MFLWFSPSRPLFELAAREVGAGRVEVKVGITNRRRDELVAEEIRLLRPAGAVFERSGEPVYAPRGRLLPSIRQRYKLVVVLPREKLPRRVAVRVRLADTAGRRFKTAKVSAQVGLAPVGG